MSETVLLRLHINGEERSVVAPQHHTLLEVLREECGLTGTKHGCELGECGTCTVLVDGRPVRSCITAIDAIGDSEITTIEGLGTIEKPHPLQQAFIDEQAAQCGYCINGMIMAAKDILDRIPHPTEQDVREGLAANLCRCGTHGRIIRAVLRAAQSMGKT
jgi:nicotinate dehydrogenase subunit A